MDESQKCADCGSEVEIGFIPDLSYPASFESFWHRGKPDERAKRILEALGASAGVKLDRSHMAPIQALRCIECGLLKFYANPD